MLLTKIIFFIFLSLSTRLYASTCSNDSELKTKINHLKMETACAGSTSIDLCQKLMADFTPVIDPPEIKFKLLDSLNLERAPTLNCESIFVNSLPFSVTLQSLTKFVTTVNPNNTKLVNSLEEFYEHTRLHRARVKALGLALLKSHPELFEGLSPRQVGAILEAHDLAKVSPKSVGPDGRPFYRILYDSYGKGLDKISVDSLNAQDRPYMEKAKSAYGLDKNPDLHAKMDRIEKIADLVDRGMSNVSAEEFGRPMDKASNFLKNDDDVKLAQELEKNYKEITKKLTYKGLTPASLRSVKGHILIEESFAKAKSTKDSLKLSARLMAHKLVSKGNTFLARTFEFLASKGVTQALKVLNLPMLYFADMGNIGCDGIGFHDWVKDPNCKPVIGLSPKILAFLDLPWGTQESVIQLGSTCRVIEEIYQQSITAPKVINCSDRAVEMELAGGDRFHVKIDKFNRFREIEFKDLSSYAGLTPAGRAEKAIIGLNGNLEQVCYQKISLTIGTKRCLGADHPWATKAKELIRSLNYQIQKGVACCRNLNPELGLKCSP